ncbi:MAG: MerR family transcriptional regulator, partial [Clostridia bacterium]|nr:MerR family transcriptional regulator [Clostridia bacterium]
MNETRYLISEASKVTQVDAHVLRYWEDELGLAINRNEMGHRYYTEKDIQVFQNIKELKKQGLQLKAIRRMLHQAE